MGSKWRKAKQALGFKSCFYIPNPAARPEDPSPSTGNIFSDDLSISSAAGISSDSLISMPMTPTPSSFGLKFSRFSSKSSSKGTCPICLTSLKPGPGHAIFTAECSHVFHFHCITSNVKHGNQICPVCRAKWKEVPFQSPVSDFSHERSRINPLNWSHEVSAGNLVQQVTSPRLDRHIPSIFHVTEPHIFDDDELLPDINEQKLCTKDAADSSLVKLVEVQTFAELSAVPRSASHSHFTVLVHLKAPLTGGRQNCREKHDDWPTLIEDSLAPIDLVTVLDVSGSMSGTKLALLKRAMGFVIQNLGPSDRLSVIAFSSNARRLFPLTRMTDTGRQQALQAVNSLTSNGGTNIAEGLKKGAKVIVDRKTKNPVSSIILLSDGQDTYTINGPRGANQIDYQSLLPLSIHRGGAGGGTGLHIPVHAFGLGIDHDAASMHSIAEMSGGTFSSIEAEGVIQDAFAQCIGGLLSVVVQDLEVEIECVHPTLELTSIKAGSYQTRIAANARLGFVDVGDLYAEEERDSLVILDIPVDKSINEMFLLRVKCIYRDPISKEKVTLNKASEIKIQRPETIGQPVMSMEVDRQRNRFRAAEAMSEARVAAEKGDLTNAVSVLEGCRKVLSESLSAQAGDRLCIALCAELKEMQERVANRRVYEETGRAYVLSGLNSHSCQRATTRGDSTDNTSLVQAYQTRSMADMVTRSQTMVFGNPSSQVASRSTRPFASHPQPR